MFDTTRDTYGVLYNREQVLDTWVKTYTEKVLKDVVDTRVKHMDTGLSPEIEDVILQHPEVLYLNVLKALSRTLRDTIKGVDFSSKDTYDSFVSAAALCVYAAELVSMNTA